MLISETAQFLRRKPLVFDKLNRLARALGHRTALYSELAEKCEMNSSFTFLQIGANDGISNDPFREFMIRRNARGLAVEPVPDYFSAMRRNYSAYKQIEPVNCAVGYPGGHLPFYSYSQSYLDSKGGSKELAGLASFSREKLVSSLGVGERAENCILEITVPVCTVEELMKTHGFERFDCLFMDCEGHEENILTQLDYEFVKPRLIVFEHTHYGKRAEKIEAHLSARGFDFTHFNYDTVAAR